MKFFSSVLTASLLAFNPFFLASPTQAQNSQLGIKLLRANIDDSSIYEVDQIVLDLTCGGQSASPFTFGLSYIALAYGSTYIYTQLDLTTFQLFVKSSMYCLGDAFQLVWQEEIVGEDVIFVVRISQDTLLTGQFRPQMKSENTRILTLSMHSVRNGQYPLERMIMRLVLSPEMHINMLSGGVMSKFCKDFYPCR